MLKKDDDILVDKHPIEMKERPRKDLMILKSAEIARIGFF